LQEEQLLDVIMLSLRLSDGLALQQLQRDYGREAVAPLLPAIQSFLQQGLMQVVLLKDREKGHINGQHSSGDHGLVDADAVYYKLCDDLKEGRECSVRLTDPAGFLLSNDVISELFAHLDPRTLNTVF
jgi:oxygen-independent coproporphyrinogen-3 oxidase